MTVMGVAEFERFVRAAAGQRCFQIFDLLL